MKIGRWLLLVVALVVCASGVSAQKWRFVVAGDGRSNPRANPPRPEDKNGINRVITSEIAKAVIAEKAKFLMFTGDLVLGAKTAEEFKTQLLAWRAIMQPVYARKIPIYAVRGNHESGSGDATRVWNQVFSGPYAMPQNGPSTEKNITFTA